MFPFLPDLLAKLRAAEEASTTQAGASMAQARAMRELIDYLQKLIPNDFRDKPSDLYKPR